MIIVMDASISAHIDFMFARLSQYGLEAHALTDHEELVISVGGEHADKYANSISRMPGVLNVISISTPYKLVSKQYKSDNSKTQIKNVIFGGNTIPIVAGPCAIEGYSEFIEAANSVKHCGAAMLRGGAFKPRTSPYSFQGLEIEGLKIMRKIADEVNMPIVTEITDQRKVEIVADYADMLQIGARNMHNYVLLKEAAQTKKPILLKRGFAATVEEWLMAAEYIMLAGNDQIVLCERGIRTFETYTRNTLDLNAVPLVKLLSHLPVIVDPSHGTGDWRLVGAMAAASIAAGADGVMIEVHPAPEEAMSDGKQSLTPKSFFKLMGELKNVARAIGRSIYNYDEKKSAEDCN